MTAHLFIGPTGTDLPAGALRGFHRHPPVEAGSLYALIEAAKAPGAIVLVDGNLEAGRPIHHDEVRAALRAGWRVTGLASVGALIAAALHGEGVCGVGLVARYARRFPQRAEDEVAALYFPTPPYAAASEPLLELRLLLRAMQRRGIIPAETARDLSATLRASKLEDRTMERITRLYPEANNIPRNEWQAKRRDLLTFLRKYQAATNF